jgi:hypothetical protein
MTNPVDVELTPTGRPARIGRLFEALTMGYAGVIVLSEAIDGRFAQFGAGYITLTVLSALLALGAGLLDRFRPSGLVGWLTVFAMIIGVLVASAPTAGTSDWSIPLLIATAPNATGAEVIYIPLLQTFASMPATLFETLAGVAFWGLVLAWILSLRNWRRAPRKKGEPLFKR